MVAESERVLSGLWTVIDKTFPFAIGCILPAEVRVIWIVHAIKHYSCLHTDHSADEGFNATCGCLSRDFHLSEAGNVGPLMEDLCIVDLLVYDGGGVLRMLLIKLECHCLKS